MDRTRYTPCVGRNSVRICQYVNGSQLSHSGTPTPDADSNAIPDSYTNSDSTPTPTPSSDANADPDTDAHPYSDPVRRTRVTATIARTGRATQPQAAFQSAGGFGVCGFGSWIVPTVTGSSRGTTYSAVWVGIDGYSDSTVEQIGTEEDVVNGGPSMHAWWEMYSSGNWPAGTTHYRHDGRAGRFDHGIGPVHHERHLCR